MKKIVMALLASVLMMMMGLGTTAEAVTRPTPAQIKKICATSFRGNADYNRYCLVTGKVSDGIRMWREIPLGKRTDRDGEFSRYAMCKYAGQYGGIRVMVREELYDVAYDHYRNHRMVLNVAGWVAKFDCQRAGYRV